MPRSIAAIITLFAACGCARAQGLKNDVANRHLDVLIDDKLAARYMYAYDTSTPERRFDTSKPFLHVYDADGKTPITKGAGGEYPHHRGIFIGWNKIKVGDKTFDRWHMKTGEIVHQDFHGNTVENGVATFTATNHWNDDDGKPFLVEERTTSVRKGEAPIRLVIDFTSTLTARDKDVTVDGDPEHAGIHFRPSDDLDRQKTVYVYSKENAKPHEDVDYQWVGETFALKTPGKLYSVVQISHPENPKGTKWSAYRNYGRFGAFPCATIKGGESLVLKYRFLIADGQMPSAERIEISYRDFAGIFAPTPVPKTTMLPAEQPKPKPDAKTKTAKPQAATAPANFKGHRSNPGPVDPPIVFDLPPPEPLAPQDALKTFALPEGLRIECVASEPMVEDPVAISFDEHGRMYVVEMRGYMQNADGDNELDPIGRIKRLSDTDGDGRMDKAEVFLDKLVLPRAVLVLRGGILVGEPPELAFWEDTDDDGKADKKTLVATDYGRREGQPEHMANTPMLALDNWIYHSAYQARHRVVRGKWVSEPTRSRGQWGISQDDAGRYYFSSNSDVARGDSLPGQYFSRNPFYRARVAQNRGLIESQEVWPSHPTPGVNRGYNEGQLRADGTLATATAAGGSGVYRGEILPAEFVGNLFTPEPSGNLIKRMIVTDVGGKLAATNAYEGKDFLTSTDERFRPVQVCTGPDGALYVVDMYKGVLQHRYFLTHYLIKNIKRRKLETPLHWGRIYRIVPTAHRQAQTTIDALRLVELLAHPNGWTRDTAQRLLVERADKRDVPQLKKLAVDGPTPLARLHALWTLEGLNRLDEATTRKALRDPDERVRAAAVRLAEPLLMPATRAQFLPVVMKLADDPSPHVQLQLVLSVGAIPDPAVEQLVADFLSASAADPDLMRDAALSGLRSRELEFVERLLARSDWETESPVRSQTLEELSRCVMNERRAARIVRLLELVGAESDTPWRQLALLRGMSPPVNPKAKKPEAPPAVGKLIYLDARPDALASLLSSDDADVRGFAERLDARLAWPGKAGVPPPPVIEPLKPADQARFDRGREVYAQMCATCHQPSGLGMEGLAPPLVDSEWVLGSSERLVRIVLHGVTGSITVNGAVYKMEMPALSALTDAEIAAALTYIRREWEHGADPVDEKAVGRIREQTKDRADLWTEEELLEVK